MPAQLPPLMSQSACPCPACQLPTVRAVTPERVSEQVCHRGTGVPEDDAPVPGVVGALVHPAATPGADSIVGVAFDHSVVLYAGGAPGHRASVVCQRRGPEG